MIITIITTIAITTTVTIITITPETTKKPVKLPICAAIKMVMKNITMVMIIIITTTIIIITTATISAVLITTITSTHMITNTSMNKHKSKIMAITTVTATIATLISPRRKNGT